ncbi:MAG: hypothetical protein L3J79_05760 [Candidatus Marinimicrobia bacterium]|nr:hypothetical protein [Candidatus Neomarinimicrobiota bacterium]
MFKQLIILLTIASLALSQSGFDILNTPTDTRDAALGISLNPTVKPTRILTHPEHNVTLSVWNWVADIQGAYLGIGLKNAYVNVQAMHSGELEYRNDIPSEDPLSTFEYTLFNMGAAHAHQWQQFTLGLGGELIYERSLNASATGISFNLAGAYQLSEKYLLGVGVRHFGITGKLDEESTSLPTEIWAELDVNFNKFSVVTEVNNGAITNAIGLVYPFLNSFEIIAGMQIEATDPEPTIHPSAGFTADWTSFTFGYSIYQLDHNLGPRHFITLYWNY